MGNNQKPNFKSYSPKKSGAPKKTELEKLIDSLSKPSKSQDSRKVHDTKGKNNHGRNGW